MRIVKFKAAHFATLRLQPAQSEFSSYLNDLSYGQSLEGKYSFTALDGAQVICCAGLVPIWPGRACAWAMLSANAGKYMIRLHRAVDGFLLAAPFHRVETTVDLHFDAGERWVKLLNFHYEGRLKRYTPDGRDQLLYSRIK